MGARPSSFKKGGGFLNNVTGVIQDYEFTPDFPGQSGERKSDSKFNPLYFVLTVLVDGADSPVTTTLFAGSADDFEILEDGKSLQPIDESKGIRSNTDLGKFIDSLCANGFDESELPDDDEPISYEAILNRRVEFVQIKDEEAMTKNAKNYRKSNGKFNEQGQKKSNKDGKFYNITYVAVSNVLETVETPKSSQSAKSSDVKDKSTKAKTTKASKGPSIEDIAKETLIAILNDNSNEIAKSALPGKIALKLGAKHPQKEEVRKLIYSDEFLETEDGWSYDKGSKKQLITLTEE